MLRDNRRRHGLLGLAAVVGAAVAVVCTALLMYPAHALTGGDALRNAINDDSAVFWRPAGAGDSAWSKTDGSSAVDTDSELRLRVAFTLPAGTLANGTTLQYKVPSSVHPDTSAGAIEGEVYASPTVADPSRNGANAIGTYSLDGDVLTLTFNEDVATANAGSAAGDGASDASADAGEKTASALNGYVDLDLGFDQLTCDESGLATIELNDAVSLKVAKVAEEAASVGSADAGAAAASIETGEDGEGAAPPASRLAKAAPAETLEAAADGDDIDLTQFINKPVKVQKKNEDGSYADPVTEFTAGDNVKATISYQIPAGTLSKDSHIVTYRIPKGLKPTAALTHMPIMRNKEILGYYTVTTDGIVTLDFNDTAIEGGTTTGSFFFQGIVSNVGDGESTEVNFGGSGGSITVKKNQESGGGGDADHDIKVEKKASKSEDDSKIYYTVTVSTEKGTPSTVDITDCLNKWNSSNAAPAYEKYTLQLKKVFSNGDKQTLGNYAAWNDSGNDGPTFSLSGLPQLSAGEKYEITYAVDSHATVTSSGATVANRASATSGEKTGESWQHVYFQQDANKSGSYDAKTDHVIWTIEVNPNGKDVSNWTVHDTLPNGTKLTQQYVVRDASNNVYGYFGSAGDSKVDFSFSQLGNLTDAQKTQKYFIDIYTDAPSSDGRISNEATTTTNTGTVDSVGTVDIAHRTTEVKKDHKTDAVADEKGAGVRKETWAPTITLPGGNLSSFTYTDTIADATDGNGVGLGADSHYAIAAELDKVFRSSAQNATVDATTGLFINVDGYSKYLYRGDGKAYYDDYWATQDGSKDDVFFTVTYYDGPDGTGNVVDATDATTHVKSFTVKVDITGSNVRAFDMRTGEYPTYLDTTKVGEGASITAMNKGKVGESSATSNFTYTRPHRILKAVGTGEHTYASGDATLDFDKIQDGKITYRIALTTEPSDNGRDIVVTDTLPRGMAYVDGSVTARFDEYYDSGAFSGDKAPQVTSAPADGGTELAFTIPNYQYHADRPTFYLYYDVSIKSDPSWNNGSTSKTYENKAMWGRSESTQTTEVDRTYEKVSKSGEQLYDESGEPTGNLRYYVEINAAAQDLDPNSDVLTLTDKFNSGSVDSDLDPSSIKLYAYDYSKEHHYDPARPIENFKASYDAKTHTIAVEVPDKRACVLTYEYTLDSSFGSITVTNNASLNGRFSKSNSIKLKEASAGADIHQGRFVLYKMDADDISKTLSGVEFKLSYWNGGVWVDKSTVNPLVTDSQGSITYDYEKNPDGLQPNILYRLAETKGKDGYAGDAERFFIVKNVPDVGSPISDDAAFSAANAGNATNKSGGTLTAADVDFFKDNKTSTMYVKNEYTRLTAKKSWADEGGVAKDAPAGASARLALFRYTKKVDTDNSVNVTVTAKGTNPSGAATKLTGNRVNNDGTVSIKKGSDFTFSVSPVWDVSFDVYVDGEKYGETHTFKQNPTTYQLDPISVTVSNVTSDTKVEVKVSSWDNSSTLTEDPNNPWVDPPQILDDATGVQVGDPVEVSASNNWTKNWDNLSKQVDGQDVYYAVRELSYTVNGKTYNAGTGSYDVSYTNNNGIQTGTITVTNSEKENQGYELPSTGGTPCPLPWVGGTLAALAGVLLVRRMRPRKS
ncbi:hypothetical protein [Tractidigestivibacter scatoligenes]|uniref:hypothetical protein n=1 Tax=Tractidigestivibacter scatoligenes TaxID=1299998 RepID=UPI002F35759E